MKPLGAQRQVVGSSDDTVPVPRRSVGQQSAQEQSPSVDHIRPTPTTRFPAVPVAISLAMGILIDRIGNIPFGAWFCTGSCLAAGWTASFVFSRTRLAACLLCAACTCLGGARHHWGWSVIGNNDISLFAEETPRPVQLTGKIVTKPYIRSHGKKSFLSGWQQYEIVTCEVDCRQLISGTQPISVSGRIRLDVVGRSLPCDVGDAVCLYGRLYRPRGRVNPGQFDFEGYLRRHGIRCVVMCKSAAAIRTTSTQGVYWFARIRGWARGKCESLLEDHLSHRVVPVALALFLGNRSGVTAVIRKSFVESGTMHLLAISGLHVGILASFLWGCGRLVNLSPKGMAILLLVGVSAYASITDARPPVIRATILVAIAAVGLPWYRSILSTNTLALAGLVVLGRNPCDLFDAGTQLSFLAVTVIVYVTAWHSGQAAAGKTSQPRSPDAARGWIGRWGAAAGARLKLVYILTGAIWIVTAPLVAAHFNVISPVGLVINVFLIPLVAIALWCGYLMLFIGLVFPSLAGLFAFGLDSLLRLLLGLVDEAAQLELGHIYVPSPPFWWLIGFYLLVAGAIGFHRYRLAKGICWRGAVLWLAAGLLIGLRPSASSGFACTFLSVGHGCSVLVETPNGKTLLYDAGTINGGSRVEQIVESALWQGRRTGIDALVISHPDIDHFNAVPGLLRKVPVGTVLVARAFLDYGQAGVVDVCRAAAVQEVPIRLIWADDAILLDRDVRITVLHPAIDSVFDSDNEASIVLLMEFAGRSILLTGDLDGKGRESLLERAPIVSDIIMSPHHGSLEANPVELAQWSHPSWVVVSGQRSGMESLLRSRYESARILSTQEEGAVRFEIRRNGAVHLATARSPMSANGQPTPRPP